MKKQDQNILNKKEQFLDNMHTKSFLNDTSCCYSERDKSNNYSCIKPWREKQNNTTQKNILRKNAFNLNNFNTPIHNNNCFSMKNPLQIEPNKIITQQQNNIKTTVPNISQQELNKNSSNEQNDLYNSNLFQEFEIDETDNYYNDYDNDSMDELNDIVNQYISSSFNDNKHQNNNKGRHLGHTKRKVDLSKRELNFKYCFYLAIIGKKKKFKKEYVRKIHDFMRGFLNFPPITRQQIRQIDLYFKEYAKHDKLIISFLKSHKNQILRLIPGLSSYLYK